MDYVTTTVELIELLHARNLAEDTLKTAEFNLLTNAYNTRVQELKLHQFELMVSSSYKVINVQSSIIYCYYCGCINWVGGSIKTCNKAQTSTMSMDSYTVLSSQWKAELQNYIDHFKAVVG